MTHEQTPNPAVIDHQVIQSLRELSVAMESALLHDLIELYHAEGQQYVSRMLLGVETGDLHQIKTASHSLKSASANLGAFEVANVCQKLEAYPAETVTDPIIAMVRQIHSHYEQASQCLGQISR